MTLLADAPAVDVGWFHATKAMDAVTQTVVDDEPCFYLAELCLPTQNGKGFKRYQILRIVRDDRLVTAYVLLGPARRFRADQFTMLGGVVDEGGRGHADHTVAEMQEWANELRSRPPRRELEPLDLQRAWQEAAEEKKRLRKRQSTYGLLGQVVRR